MSPRSRGLRGLTIGPLWQCCASYAAAFSSAPSGFTSIATFLGATSSGSGTLTSKHAILVVGLDLVCLHFRRQCHGAGKGTIPDFSMVCLAFFVFLLGFALAFEGEVLAFNAQFDFFGLDAGQVSFDCQDVALHMRFNGWGQRPLFLPLEPGPVPRLRRSARRDQSAGGGTGSVLGGAARVLKFSSYWSPPFC